MAGDFRVILPYNFVNGTTADANEMDANLYEQRDKYNSSLSGTLGHAHSGADGDGTKLGSAAFDLTANYPWTGLHTFTQAIAVGWAGPAAYKFDLRPTSNASQFHISRNSTDTGGYLGSGTNDSVVALSGGAANNGAAWVAKATAASILITDTGDFNFYGNTGLTVGNTFTPTRRFLITVLGDVVMNPTNQLFFDSGVDTSIRESAPNTLAFRTGGTDRAFINGSGTLTAIGTGALAGKFQLASAATNVVQIDPANSSSGGLLINGLSGEILLYLSRSGATTAPAMTISDGSPTTSSLALFKSGNTAGSVASLVCVPSNANGAGKAIGIDFSNIVAANGRVFQMPTDNTDPTGGGGAATGRIPIMDASGNLRYIAYY